MSGPYVCLRVNRVSRAILTDTVAFEPDPMASFTNPFEWLVVCDSADKVVVRALEDGKRTQCVIAIATLRGLHLDDRRQLEPDQPTEGMWSWLEDVVFATRERGHAKRQPDAFDDAVLSVAPPPPTMSPEAVWAMAATATAPVSSRSAAPLPPARQAAPLPPAPPAAPLWGPPSPEKLGAASSSRHVELLFDHANVLVVAGSVRYAPDRALRPSSPYQMKVICDSARVVTIQAQGELDLVTIATACWRDSALCDRRQQGSEPDDFQWIALEDGLRAELARAP